MKIHVFGASGAGSTTLASELADKLNYKHLDADDYYWKLTDPPYQEKIPLAERSDRLRSELQENEGVVVSGSLVTWGEFWTNAFDLAIFLLIPPDIRLKRLMKREKERYGSQLDQDPSISKNSRAFLEWARKYDNPEFEGRSISQHEDWIKKLACKTLKIEGDTSVEKRIQLVTKYLRELQNDLND